jgi:hypothetical protein
MSNTPNQQQLEQADDLLNKQDFEVSSTRLLQGNQKILNTTKNILTKQSAKETLSLSENNALGELPLLSGSEQQEFLALFGDPSDKSLNLQNETKKEITSTLEDTETRDIETDPELQNAMECMKDIREKNVADFLLSYRRNTNALMKKSDTFLL